MTKIALLSGVTGQDGSYLAELLLEKGYEVHALTRWHSTDCFERIEHIKNRLHLHICDLSQPLQLSSILCDVYPQEVYNLGAMSHVRESFNNPIYTAEITGLGALNFLEALRKSGVPANYYQASSSEMFGSSPPPQSESTIFHPRSPYACAKVFAYNVVVNYREAYGMHASNGILFNHESPRRGTEFVTQKICRAAAAIAAKKQDCVYLGNLDSKRDWGHAKDYVEAMWLMLQQQEPDDFVIATGEMYTVRQFAKEAFGYVGLNYEDYVRFDAKLLRPTEVDALQGDPSKARQILGWRPKYSFAGLVRDMMEAAINES